MSRKTKLTQYKCQTIATGGAAEVKASAEGQEGPGTFEGIAYSGGLVPGHTSTPRLDHPYVIDLSGTERARNVYANLSHDPDKDVGHVTEVENDGKQLRIRGLLSAETPHRDQVAKSSQNGHPYEFSIEGNLGGRKFVPRGQSAVVNGQTFQGPFYRMTRNTFTDVAFVKHGADGGNEARIAASTAGEVEMTEFEKFALSCGVDLESASDENKANLQMAFDAKAKVSASAPKPETLSFSEGAAAEREITERNQKITTMALTAMREYRGNPVMQRQIEEFGRRAIEENMDEEKFELALLREVRSKPGTFTTQARPQSDPKVIEAALCRQFGLPDLDKHYSEQVLNATDDMDMRGFGLQSIMLEVACANGYTCGRVPKIHPGNVREVLEFCFPPVHARLSGFSTVSLPGILGNVANKAILSGYMEEDNTWQEISTIRNVSNFHTHSYFRLLDNVEYEEVGAGGEIQHGTLGQESYTVKAKTYAKMLGINHEQIINDDLGAFDDLRAILGRGAAKKFSNIVWGTYMSNFASIYTSARGNIVTANPVLDINGSGLQTGITAYRKLKSPSADGQKRVGNALGRPTKIVVPPELEFIAMRLYQSTLVNTGGSSSNDTVGNANIHAGLYRPVVQDRLSDSAFTGNSSTQWMLLGNTYMPMAVSFLNGQRTPSVESTEADFNQLGILFRGVFYFGADPAEYMSVRSSGAGS